MQFSQLKRREFITLLGGATVWPLAAHAQQPAMSVIGFLNGQSPGAFAHIVAAFHRGLGQAGYVEGRNVAIEYRWAEGRMETLPALAAELVRRSVDLIVATGGAHLAAKAATSTVPIVFTSGGDPIKEGLVASFNRPGGNATGATVLSATLAAKRLGIVLELNPTAASIGALVDPSFSEAPAQLTQLQEAVRATGQQLHVLNGETETEIDTAFASISRAHVDVLLVGASPFLRSRRDQIAALATRRRIPTLAEGRDSVESGLLMSYGPSITDIYRQVGIYAGRILKGEKPADLPVIQPSKFELVINLKTAKALGLTIPDKLLAIADEVIE
jgi:putative tryptophan/tyrosine transport system substrate-binding protein